MTQSPMSPEVVSVLVANHDRFLAFLAPRVGGRENAEELLQAAFVKGIERGGSIRDDESVLAWFYRLLRNAIVDHYRHRAAESRALDREPLGPVETGLETVVCQCVNELVPTLKPEYEEVLRLVDLDGVSVTEAADRLGITPNNVSVRLHRARQALKRQLERTCGTCTEHGCLDCTCEESTGRKSS